ncbi:hypothetical protein OV450_7766 [Actinobacteria bacterium OV450]|nr:hypothetical protein OV450_7766 [Actinobacteria bacterium OV450]
MALLRRLIDGVLATLYTRYGLKELPDLCQRLGLPAPDEGSTRHERLVASLNACPDGRLPDVADAVLEQEELGQAERMALQDVLWLGRHHVQIPSRTRRELARDFDLSGHLGYPDRFMALRGRLWHLDNDPMSGWVTSTSSLRDQTPRLQVPGRLVNRGVLRAARRLRSPSPTLRRLPRGAGLRRRPSRRASPAPLRRARQPASTTGRRHPEPGRRSRRLPPVPPGPARPRHRAPAAQPHLRHPGQARHPLHQRPRQRHRGRPTRRQSPGL